LPTVRTLLRSWISASPIGDGGSVAVPTRRRPLLLAAIAATLGLMLFLALGTSLAQAAPFAYDAAASEELSNTVPGGAFGEPFGLTFDSAGDLFVTDTSGNAGTGVVDKFNSENVFQAQLGATSFTNAPRLRGIAVNDESGHLYVGDLEGASEPLTGSLYALDGAGTELSQWLGSSSAAGSFGEHAVSAAVDNSPSVSHGDVYVAVGTAQGGEVDLLKPSNGDAEEGELVGRLASPEGFKFEGNVNVAVDQANGEVYVVDEGHKVVDRFSPEGAFEAAAQLTGPALGEPFQEPLAVAVNSANGHVFIVDNRLPPYVVDEFGATGELLRQISETTPNQTFGRVTGVADQERGPHAGALYVVDSGAKKVDVFAELPPGAPQIESVGVSLVGGTATLHGEIDPRGAPTGYRFEFGACSTAITCATSPFERLVPVPDGALGFEDFNAHSVTPVQFQGLGDGTTYHFRLVAHNSHGEVGEERIFTIPAPNPFALPDDRQWQLVSPPDKDGAQVNGGSETGIGKAAADGSEVTYLANAPTESDPAGSSGEVQVLSSRNGAGWSSRDIATPHVAATGDSPGTAPEYRFFSEDLSNALVQPFGLFNPVLSGSASEQTPYLRKLGDCTSSCFTPIVTGKLGFANVSAGTKFGEELLCEENNGIHGVAESVCGPQFQGASPDGSHVVLRSQAPLAEGVPSAELYEWSAGHLFLVSVLAENGAGEELPAPTGAALEEQPLLGAQFGLPSVTTRRAVSANGSRVFWESGGKLYVRDTAIGRSLEVDAPEAGCVPCAGEGGAGRFQIASASGIRVFFTDTHHLTSDSGARAAEPDLYECKISVDAEGKLVCSLSDITPAEGGESANVQGDLLGASEDGSEVYFVADGTLGDAGATRGSCINAQQPAGATCNLYEHVDGEGTKLVAALSGDDARDWAQGSEHQPTRVSPDGRYLAFLSERPLTGYDNRDAVSGKADAEVFLYDAIGAGQVRCASCDPSGARPVGVEYKELVSGESEALPAVREEWERSGWVAALLPHTSAFGVHEPDYQPRYLSDSGRLYFNSLDALVPSDTNATGDVYQYELPAVGNCTTASATYSTRDGGCVDLISSGTSPQRSAFLDASESGNDVFFLTSSRLSPQDVDNAQDVYDAHSCEEPAGCLTEPAPPAPPCTGEACQGHVAAPVEATPESQSFSGPGNPVTCRKGQVKKAGKCVKSKAKPKHKGKKSKGKKAGRNAKNRHAKSKRGAGK
jgi:hypothetical protein